MAAAATFAIACGDDGPPQDIVNDPGQEDTITPDTGRDTATPDIVQDVPVDTNVTPDEGVDTNVTPDVADVNVPDVAPDVPPDVVDIVEDEFVKPMCPCDQNVNEPVCGVDEVTYASANCAACELCADAPDCPGCGGEIDCDTSGDTNFLLRRTSCDECPCILADECEAQVQPIESCGVVCGIDGETEYTDLCDLKAKNHCAAVLDDLIGYFGECAEPICVPCEAVPDAAVCGSDGKDYRNKCELLNCPAAGEPGSVTQACAQKCPCPA